MSYPAGKVLGGEYRIEKLLGQGAFGEVYLATSLSLDAQVAIKILKREPSGVRKEQYQRIQERFKTEAKLGHRLNHVHIVRVHALDKIRQIWVLAMDYLPGGSLKDRIQIAKEEGKPLAVDLAVTWTIQAAEGLAEMHRRDLVHRDLKPSNILIGEDDQAKISDLGVVQEPGTRFHYQYDDHPGDPAYMPPEQRPGERMPLRPAADIYALGCVLFELLTGELYYNQYNKGVRLLRKDVPRWLDELVAILLDEDYRKRPADGEKVALLLRQGLEKHRRKAAGRPSGSGRPRRQLEPIPLKEVQLPSVTKVEPPVPVSVISPEPTPVIHIPPATVQQISENEMGVRLAEGVEMAFRRIPSGEFLMGSDPVKDKYAQEAEKPQHKVFLDEYWMGKYPVTNRQYAAYVIAKGVKPPEHWVNGKIPAGKEDHPVVNVRWRTARDFCHWTSEVSGKAIRLPSEAEWEKAARGTDGRLYPWGDKEPDGELCNYGKLVGDTTRVGRYSPQGDSRYGCADMAGNVWEWTRSLWGKEWDKPEYGYPYRAGDGRENEDAPDDVRRVLRGGSWLNNGFGVRSANRHRYTPDYRLNDIGFRCVSSL